MSNTVYVFGAGVNQSIRDKNGVAPPLATDFFDVASKTTRLQSNDSLYAPLYSYIFRYWKKTPADLTKSRFNLEDLFTLLDLHFEDATDSNDEERRREILNIRVLLLSLLAQVLNEFEIHASLSTHLDTDELIDRAHEDKDRRTDLGQLAAKALFDYSTIITFNYDTLFERLLEVASG